MEKRAILAIVLSLCVVIVWSIFLAPSSPPPVEREAIEQETLLGMPVKTTLHARGTGRWRRLARRDSAWIGLLSFLLPFGLSFTHSREHVYVDWFGTNEPTT